MSFRNNRFLSQNEVHRAQHRGCQGSGTERRYSFSDLLALHRAGTAGRRRFYTVSAPSRRLSANVKGIEKSARRRPPYRHRSRRSGGDQP